MEVKEIKAKHILVKCGIPGIDFVINPYIGCSFACKYCYASFMGRFVGKQISDWGNYVYAKINAPELLKRDIVKITNKGAGKEIFLSSVTDPYQGLEVKYTLTRQCLEILADFGLVGIVSILTKSDLVTRDIDIFKKLKRVLVGLTITSTNDSVSRYFEKYAPPVSLRFEALKKLNNSGIETYAFIGPLLPHFVARSTELDRLFAKLKRTGTRNIFMEHLNLSTYIKSRLTEEMKGQESSLLKKFYSSQSMEYRSKLEEVIKDLIKKYDMRLLTDMVIFHSEFRRNNIEI
jgi:DNA repair photolyase